jgi:hypothetical protein
MGQSSPIILVHNHPIIGRKARSITLNAVETLRLSGLRAMADGRHIVGVGIEVGLMLVG